MESTLYKVDDKLVVDNDVRTWCRLPYPSHPYGCPNYGGRKTCPPNSPCLSSMFNLEDNLFFVTTRFDLGEYVQKMHVSHPSWSEAQCRNLLYWQGSVRSELVHVTERMFDYFKPVVITYVPEAMGVDVFSTCTKLGLVLERNPMKYVYKVALVGRPRDNR